MDNVRAENVGSQPCDDFTEHPDEFLDCGIYMAHECPVCWKKRWYCGNCNRDHHEGGWESCKVENRSQDEREGGEPDAAPVG